MAVFPFYLEMILMGVDIPGLAVFRVVRLVRVFRLLKMSRSSITIFVQTMKRSAKPLFMLIFFTSIATVSRVEHNVSVSSKIQCSKLLMKRYGKFP